MLNKKSFLKWLSSNGKDNTCSNQQRNTIRKTFHRGYYIENSSGNVDNWIARVNDELITGKLELIKKSIDWWCDMKKVFPPESFELQNKEAIHREVIDYEGFKIINDTGEHNEWYMYHNGRLFKGTRMAIEAKIDIAIKNSRKSSAK